MVLPFLGSCTRAQRQASDRVRACPCAQVVLPFGVTLLARGWQDEWLWGLAASMHRASGLGCGPEGHGVGAANGSC